MSKILFRPHRGTLADSLKEQFEAANEKQIFEYLENRLGMKGQVLSIQSGSPIYDRRPQIDCDIFPLLIKYRFEEDLCCVGYTYSKISYYTNPDIIHPDQTIRALSWRQPFAELMLHGKVETRTWSTKYRGLVLICASVKQYSEMELLGISGEAGTQRIFTTLNGRRFLDPTKKNGYAIAIGRLVDCRKMTNADGERCFVKYHPSLYVHMYEDVRPIVPFEWKGAQGWRTLTDEQKQKIQFQNL